MVVVISATIALFKYWPPTHWRRHIGPANLILPHAGSLGSRLAFPGVRLDVGSVTRVGLTSIRFCRLPLFQLPQSPANHGGDELGLLRDGSGATRSSLSISSSSSCTTRFFIGS